MEDVLWEKVKLVIFDVDGTLYHQSKLRKIMLFRLLTYYFIRPWRYNELLILHYFRKERENNAGTQSGNLEEEQYEWCADKLNIKVGQVKTVINKWVLEEPNPYLRQCMYPGVAAFFKDLKINGIKTAIYSDYDAADKLKYMQLQTDLEVSSTDKRVNSFKPSPKGLELILSELKITEKDDCLFIGDRMERDGLCAAHAGIPFLLVEEGGKNKDFYLKLSTKLYNSRTK